MANANGPERAKVGWTGFQEGTRLCKGTRKQLPQHNIKGNNFQTFDRSQSQAGLWINSALYWSIVYVEKEWSQVCCLRLRQKRTYRNGWPAKSSRELSTRSQGSPEQGATFANDLNKSRMWGVVCIPIWLIGGDADKRSKHKGRAKRSQVDGYHSSHTQMPCLALEIYINFGWCALPVS